MRRPWPLACTLLLASIARGAQTPEEIQAEADIRQALAGWVEAANRGDWKAALKVWAPDLMSSRAQRGICPGCVELTTNRADSSSLRSSE